MTLDTCIGCLVKHRMPLHDERALHDGLPIATGVIESACRHLVKDRMDRTGLAGRSEARSPCYASGLSAPAATSKAYWAFHLQQE